MRGLVVVADAHGLVVAQRVQRGVDAGQQFADAPFQLFAVLDEGGVRADAGVVDHHPAFVEAHQVDAGHAAGPDRLDGLGHGVAPDVLGEMVERPGRKHRQREPGIVSDRRGGGHRAISPADRQHLGAPGHGTQDLFRVVVGTQLDDLGSRQLGTDLVEHPGSIAAARCRVDDQDDSGAGGSWRGLDPERFGSRQRRLDDRWHQPPAQHGDAGADAESGEDIARVMRSGRHPGQTHQAGQQCQGEPQRRILQPDPDSERGRTGRMPGRQ